jgi:hypothetical protein
MWVNGAHMSCHGRAGGLRSAKEPIHVNPLRYEGLLNLLLAVSHSTAEDNTKRVQHAYTAVGYPGGAPAVAYAGAELPYWLAVFPAPHWPVAPPAYPGAPCCTPGES